MITAQAIEQSKAGKDAGEKPKRGKHPNSQANLVAPWTTETAPKSPGRPKDTAADIARKAFDNNQQAIYEAYAKKLMSGDSYAFSVLSDRAFGKLKQGFVHTGDEDGGPINTSIKVEFVKPE
jgi:hypothetical protein